MKNKASSFIKKVLDAITAMAKAKMIFSAFKNRKLLITSISNKLQALTSRNEEQEINEQNKAIVIYNALKMNSIPNACKEVDEFEDSGGGSVIDIVKHLKEDGGQEFKLEDEIDEVADLFIKRFHRQMKIQKQLSFKRHQEMLLNNGS